MSSVGGGFVVTAGSLQIGGENVFYKQTDREAADPARRRQDHGTPTSDTSSPGSPSSRDGIAQLAQPAGMQEESVKREEKKKKKANGKTQLS